MKIAYDATKSSLFHNIDPINKFIWCFLVAIWLISLRDIFSVVIVSMGILVFVIFASKLSLKKYLLLSCLLLSASIFIIIFQGIFQEGEGLKIWFISLSYNGLILGTAIALRTFGFLASSIAFTTTTKPKDISLLMIKLGFSYRIAHVLYLVLRFIPLFETDAETINDMYNLRGVKKNLDRFIKSIITIVSTELRRADETAIALETRAFGLYKRKTIINDIKISRSGLILNGITIILIITHIILKTHIF